MIDPPVARPGYRPSERIVLVEHDPSWSHALAAEASAISAALGDRLVAVHHIGSTAIPGIAAKPVIDMLAAVTDVALLDGAATGLESLGYEGLGEFGITGRRYFRKTSSNGVRTHQIHAFSAKSPELQRHLDFRDYLRAHSDDAQAYEALKHDLAGTCLGNIDAYTDGKTGFIREIERRAAIWRRTTSTAGG